MPRQFCRHGQIPRKFLALTVCLHSFLRKRGGELCPPSQSQCRGRASARLASKASAPTVLKTGRPKGRPLQKSHTVLAVIPSERCTLFAARRTTCVSPRCFSFPSAPPSPKSLPFP